MNDELCKLAKKLGLKCNKDNAVQTLLQSLQARSGALGTLRRDYMRA